MSEPHVIRLRGFWAAELLPDGTTRYTRPFGRPREHAPGETLFLSGPGGRVELNGERLGETAAGERFAFDVTGKLLPRNTLAITAAVEPDGVALEIRRPGEPGA